MTCSTCTTTSETNRIDTELGLRGASFHTRFQGVSLDSQWIVRAVERLGERGMVPVVHVMDETPEEALWKLAQIIESDLRDDDKARILGGNARALFGLSSG